MREEDNRRFDEFRQKAIAALDYWMPNQETLTDGGTGVEEEDVGGPYFGGRDAS